MDFAAVTDPSNPFATTGLSKECLALIQYVIDAKRVTGLDLVVTSTTDHPPLTSSGNPSRHVAPGTNGKGLAIDFRMRKRGLDIHLSAFLQFLKVEAQFHELIYADYPYNIKDGKRVKPYAVSGHRDHCHASVDKGVFVEYPGKGDDLEPDEREALFAIRDLLQKVYGTAVNTEAFREEANKKLDGLTGTAFNTEAFREETKKTLERLEAKIDALGD